MTLSVKRALELDRVRSRQRVLAANAGQSIDGSFGLLMDQAVLDYGINQRIGGRQLRRTRCPPRANWLPSLRT